jgi:tetratricopeptide (TPR) repeat protein
MMNRLRYLGLKWRAIACLVIDRRGPALALFEAMLREFPGDHYALASRAQVLSQLGRRVEALQVQRVLIDSAPEVGAYWFNYGFMLEEAEDFAGAEAAFRRATELNPGLDRAWYGLGLVLIRFGRLEEAAEALKRNTKLQPMSPYGWYQLARVHAQRQEPDEARKIIRHLQRFEPKVAAQLERETGLAVPRAS